MKLLKEYDPVRINTVWFIVLLLSYAAGQFVRFIAPASPWYVWAIVMSLVMTLAAVYALYLRASEALALLQDGSAHKDP